MNAHRFDYELVCADCGRTRSASAGGFVCACGGLLGARWTAAFPRERIASRPATLWRYREALPFGDLPPLSFGEGMTPLIPAPASVGLGPGALLKLDFMFPSGSFKDRGATTLVTALSGLGVRHVLEDSSGNAGAAIAAYCALAGIACDIYVPAGTSPGKLNQIGAMGAKLITVEGGRAATAAAALAAAQSGYYASHVYNPFFLAGTRTCAFEIWEQLGWRAPEAVAVPVGNGSLLLGVYQGFRDLLAAGEIDALPRILAFQSEACAPLAAAHREQVVQPLPVEPGDTLAEGIRVAAPARGKEILAAVAATGGSISAVGEAEIRAALRRAIATGLFIEPTAAVALAGLAALPASDRPGETVVVLTGSGLKFAGWARILKEEGK
ncbi:MAG: pyridoxal-phosphate dependent enzyme [Chloroflexota bacterium]